jgi:hypothetical protein
MGFCHFDRIPTAAYIVGFNSVTCVCVFLRARLGVTWLIILRGQNRIWVLEIVIFEGDKLERGGRLV